MGHQAMITAIIASVLLLIIAPFENVYRLRVITSSGTRYMTRFYLRGTPRMADGTSPYGPHGEIRTEAHRAKGIGLYLHKIHMSDDRPELHNHPWKWAYALVLWGGYSEERLTPAGVVRRRIRPGRFVRLSANDWHRLDLIAEAPSYSLFITGPLQQAWGFLDRKTFKFTHSRDYT